MAHGGLSSSTVLALWDDELENGLRAVGQLGLGNEGLGRVPVRLADSDTPPLFQRLDQVQQPFGLTLGARYARLGLNGRGDGQAERAEIHSKGGDAVLMSAEDFDSWQETIYLLRSPANARRLMEAVERDRSGRGTVEKTVAEPELQDLAGE
jgi:hypothetical protein